MDSILVTTTTTMRIAVAVNLLVILLALAVGAATRPISVGNPNQKDPLAKG
jgi:hypothetical protein